MRRLRPATAAISALLALTLSACAHTTQVPDAASDSSPAPVAHPPITGVPFSPHFVSYASATETEEVLRSRDYQWKSLPSDLLASSPDAAAFVISTIELRDYIHLGFHGKAVLIFSNDRLMLFEFFPKNPKDNLRPYEAAAKDYDRNLNDIDQVSGSCLNCRIFGPMTSKQGGQGFVWADRRLVSETPEFSGGKANSPGF